MNKDSYITAADNRVFEVFFLLKEEGNFIDAFNVLNPLAKEYSKNFKIFFLLGSVLFQNKNYSKAIKYLKKSILLNPKYSLSSLCLIHSLAELEKWEEVFIEIRRYLLSKSRNVEEHIFLIKELNTDKKQFSSIRQAEIEKLMHEFRHYCKK